MGHGRSGPRCIRPCQCTYFSTLPLGTLKILARHGLMVRWALEPLLCHRFTTDMWLHYRQKTFTMSYESVLSVPNSWNISCYWIQISILVQNDVTHFSFCLNRAHLTLSTFSIMNKTVLTSLPPPLRTCRYYLSFKARILFRILISRHNCSKRSVNVWM